MVTLVTKNAIVHLATVTKNTIVHLATIMFSVSGTFAIAVLCVFG